MATLADIAREVGCSIKTVSRAINDGPEINANTRARILAVAARLGYAPNGPARSLVTGRTRTIGLIITHPTYPSYATIIDAVARTMSRHGYGVLLANTSEDYREEERALQMLHEHMVDGILLSPVQVATAHLQALKSLPIPVVLINRNIPELALDFVGADYGAGAFMATSHLIHLGHRRIAFLGEAAPLANTRDRLVAYRRALAEHGLRPDERLIRLSLPSIVDVACAYEVTLDLLRMDPPCTAIFAFNPYLYPGIVRAVRKAGKQVPRDVALIANGDATFGPYCDVALTCVDIPFQEMGEQAALLLLRRIAGEEAEQPEKIVVHPRLTVRESCGASLVANSGQSSPGAACGLSIV